ncbi:hypothetical protein LVD13_12780 [Flavobacteriaceae bacterium D16]|nr:hypothetical protein [Flavobacteriaceae bacterium D16]
MRPKRNPLQERLILPLGFGWSTDNRHSRTYSKVTSPAHKSGEDHMLPFEQIKML